MIFGQKCVFFTKKFDFFFGSNYSSFIRQLNTDEFISELSIMRYMFSNFFCMGYIWKRSLAILSSIYKPGSIMGSRYSGYNIAEDHIYTDITTCNIEEPQQKYRLETVSNRLLETCFTGPKPHHQNHPYRLHQLYRCLTVDVWFRQIPGIFLIDVSLFYAHGKQLWSCRDRQST